MTDAPVIVATDMAQIRAAVVARLKDKIPNVDIAEHGGTWDEAEIKRYPAIAPAMRVAIVGCGKGHRWHDGRWMIPVNLAVLVAAKDTPASDRASIVGRDVAALLLATAVELAVQGHRFGLSGVRQPENLVAKNEYSGAIDGVGLALWQVNWTSEIAIGETPDESIAAILAVLANNGDASEAILGEAP